MSAKKNVPWSNSIFTTNQLNQAISNIREDVRRNIQYNHCPDSLNQHHTNFIRRIINRAVKHGDVGTNGIAETIQEYIKDYQVIQLMAKNNRSTIRVRFDEFNFVPSECSEHKLLQIQHKIDSRIQYAKDILTVCEPRNVLVVPKNSDKSTSAYRKFITKPFINEVIIGTLCHAMNRESQDIAPISTQNIDIQFYGAGLQGTNSYPEQRSFRHYITEYESFIEAVQKVTKFSNGFVQYFDISKFFESIDIRSLTNMIIANFERNINSELNNRVKRFIASCFTFDAVDNRKGKTITYNTGLTIETHYQHLLANVYIREIMKEIVSELEHIDGGCTIINYIDDFYIHAKSEEAVAKIFTVIRDTFDWHGLKIAESKTSEILPARQVAAEMKQLVRLPASSYFEMVMAFIAADMDNAKELSVLGEKYSIAYPHDLINATKELEKWHYLFENKLNLGIIVDSINRALLNDNAIGSGIDKIPSRVLNAIARLAVKKELDKVEKENLANNQTDVSNRKDPNISCLLMELSFGQYYTKQIQKSFAERVAAIGSTKYSYYPRVSSGLATIRAQKARLYINDLQYWIDNREKFLMATNPDDYIVTLINMMKDFREGKPDADILALLQQFYLTEFSGSLEHAQKFVNLLLELKLLILCQYPAKISFLAGILRRFWTLIPKEQKLKFVKYTQEDVVTCEEVLTHSTDEMSINEAYLAYRFFRFKITP